MTQTPISAASHEAGPSAGPSIPWCKCGVCQIMPQEIENKCCGQRKCVTTHTRFHKLCLDPDVLQLTIRNRGDIRNDREDNSTRSFRKASYRQYVLDRYGYLGKGNRKVCPACVVKTVRHHYPSQTGVYMGFRHEWAKLVVCFWFCYCQFEIDLVCNTVWPSFKLPFNTNKTCYMCTSFMPKAQIRTRRMVQSLKTLLFMLSFPKFLSMDTFLFYSVYKDIMDQSIMTLGKS